MWIELHDSSRDHPKILKLARKLKIDPAHALGLICSLWTWTLRMAPDGNLSSFEPDDIEIGAGWTGEEGAFVAACRSKPIKLLDAEKDGLVCHDWEDYSGSLKAAKRARDYRKRKRTKHDGHVTVTSQCGDITQTERPNDRTTERTNETREADTPPPKSKSGHLQVEIQELAQTWADEAKQNPPPIREITGDLKARMAQAIDSDPSLDRPKKAIKGRFIQAREKNAQTPSLAACFPYVDKNHKYQLDMTSWYQDLITTAEGRKETKPWTGR